MSKFNENDVVQFNEKHKWCGCLGIIEEVKEIKNDTRYMVGVPMPEQGVAYMFTEESKDEIEYIGLSHFKLADGDTDE